ncbi:hypothetical protein ACIBVL_03380 [Streptomyces sp. NPDC049687]|uniref:hypothetical protein n=1 Tax=Streptomyces sp. NPDC049687 TaxID=3365596 RepID=UPI003787AE1D
MEILVLIGLLVFVIGGCVCVVWASRGGPRWVRVVAAVTLGLGEALRAMDRRSRRSSSGSQSYSDD